MKKFIPQLLVALLFFTCFQTLHAQPGSVDSSFGKNGIVKVTRASSVDYASGVAVLPDGKILQCGTTLATGNGIFCVSKYNEDGSTDKSFGTNGKSAISFGVNNPGLANTLAVQPDGKIILGGYALADGINTGFALARLNADGSPDESFGNKGKVVTVLADLFVSQIYGLAVQPDGKIVASGYTVGGRVKVEIAVVRYMANGNIDTNFGNNGKVIPSFPGDANAFASTITPAGKIIIGGYLITGTGTSANQSGLLLQLNADGSFDNNFGKNGATLVAFANSSYVIHSLSLQPDGRIVTGGEAIVLQTLVRSFGLARINPNGTADASFGTNGLVKTNINSNEGIVSIALQEDGKIVAGGAYSSLARYNANGSLDNDFGKAGIVHYRSAFQIPTTTAIAIQNGNKVISGGYLYNVNGSDFVMRRNNLTDNTARAFAEAVAYQRSAGNLKIVIAPNPAVSYFTLSTLEKLTGKIIVTISTPEGILMQQHIISNSSESIYVSNLKKGVYRVQVSANNKQFVSMLIKD